MSIFSKTHTGLKYSQWKRDFTKWAAFTYLNTRFTPNNTLFYWAPLSDQSSESKDIIQLKLCSVPFWSTSMDTPKTVYDHFLEFFEQTASELHAEKEDIQFLRVYTRDDFQEVLEKIRKENIIRDEAGFPKIIVEEGFVDRVFENNTGPRTKITSLKI